MSRIRGGNTKPEITVRKLLHGLGFRFRLHVKTLPGKPDIVLPRHRKVILVHGCFWHGHQDCSKAKRPATNAEFWDAKITANIERDRRNKSVLEDAGWQVLELWTCELKDPEELSGRLKSFLLNEGSAGGVSMARRSKQEEPESLRKRLVELLADFEQELEKGDLRSKVLCLVPAHNLLRDLGSSLISKEYAPSARERIIHYLQKYPRTVISGNELMVVAGIGEWARRVRELRVQFGWSVVNGVTAKEMSKEGDLPLESVDVSKMGPDDYLLLDETQDRDAAFRWNTANEIRRKKTSVQSKILEYMRVNIGKQITGEELRYVADNKSEWARRVRELRTEQGWPVATRTTGMPDLPVGVYLLVEDRQAPEHDRVIPDAVRRAVLQRDDYKCSECGWHHEKWNPSDPRHLEAHHVQQHAKGGANTEENLITLCNICHDKAHRK